MKDAPEARGAGHACGRPLPLAAQIINNAGRLLDCPEAMTTRRRQPEAEPGARREQPHPLLEQAEPHLEVLCDLLGPGPFGLALLGGEGVVLWSREQGTRCPQGLLVGSKSPPRGEPFRLVCDGVACLGEPVVAASRGVLASLVLCEPRAIEPGHDGLLRLAARSLGVLFAEVPDAHERFARSHAAVMKQIPAAILVLDAKTGRVLMSSKHAEDLFGGPLPDLITRAPPSGVASALRPRHPDGRPLQTAELPMLRAAATGEPIRDLELLVEVRPGRDARIQVSVVPVVDENRSGVLVVTFVDVTRQRAAEREREQILAAERAARESAEASGRVRERMVAVLGHDLRQPLSAVMLALDALESEQQLDASMRTILRRTRRSAGRIEAMIRDLLDFSVSAAGLAVRVDPQEADLRGIAESVVEELQLVDPKLAVKIRVAGNLRGSWDEGRLEQVMTNLITNAARYGEPGAPVEVRLAGDDQEVSVEVRNRGEPIPAEVQDRLFQPFVRASRKGPGLGLGLFIVREIARAHGGTVALCSSARKGTVVTVNLPRRCQLREA
ncbi:MAG: ATP-binding protein [Myxococcales bacterium]